MKISNRDAGIILGAFAGIVLLGVLGYLWHSSRVPSGSASTSVSGAPEAEDVDSAVEGILAEWTDSRVAQVAASGLFLPLSGESGVRTIEGSLTPVSVETRAVVDVTETAPRPQPGGSSGRGGVGPPVSPPGGGSVPGGEGSGTGVVAAPAAAIEVAITGVIVGGKTARVLVESNPLGQAQWVDVPGEAFGYRVRYATVRGAVLEKDGRTYVLVLGANKKARGGDDYKVPGAGGSGPSGAMPGQMQGPQGGPDPEAMMRMNGMRNGGRWGGRGGGFRGGGPPGGGPPGGGPGGGPGGPG